ncbi:hypothetical protein SDJN02_06249, partial [Cucurbita argyrosperma subsp. argyrosperma]
MASKRQRDEAQMEEMSEGEELKRQKSYDQILSLLEEEEEEAVEDLSSIISSLQQEISSSSSSSSSPCSTKWHPISKQTNTQKAEMEEAAASAECGSVEDYASCCCCSSSSVNEEEGGERERVMRHLLEASDDELGIPNSEFMVGEGVDGVALCDALWELEDEAANYYTLFHSQLFM